MKRHVIFLDSFTSDFAGLPTGRRTVKDGLRALLADPRVSTFDRGAPWMESLLRDLRAAGLVAEDRSAQYPWHRFVVTDAGIQRLRGSAESGPPKAEGPPFGGPAPVE